LKNRITNAYLFVQNYDSGKEKEKKVSHVSEFFEPILDSLENDIKLCKGRPIECNTIQQETPKKEGHDSGQYSILNKT